jgi:hypothetical protein
MLVALFLLTGAWLAALVVSWVKLQSKKALGRASLLYITFVTTCFLAIILAFLFITVDPRP